MYLATYLLRGQEMHQEYKETKVKNFNWKFKILHFYT